MRKEDVKVGMKVLVKSSTYGPSEETREMVGCAVEVRRVDDDATVSLYNSTRTDHWWFNVSDIEPAEAPQAPSVTINGTVYVPEDTIKAPEPAPAPKFSWGQWVKVERDARPAMVVQPNPDSDGDIRVIALGSGAAVYRQASLCTPIGA